MSRKFKLWRYTTIIWSCLCFVDAGPVERTARIIREVYPEIEPEKVEGSQAQVCIVGDVVYGAGETVPADQSCLKCRCQPPGVHCETTHCEKKPGCRAIHKPNNCCPVYQCECEYKGKTYANGERLETTSEGECKVCYCRGGEVKCAEVSCYIRTDCEGRTVPGQCCPKYEHCPPIEPTLDKLAIKPDSLDYKSTTEAATRSVIFSTSKATSVENEILETTPSYLNKNFTVEIKDSNDGTVMTTQIPPEISISYAKYDTEASDEKGKGPSEHHREPPKITIHEIIPEAKEIISETQKEEVQRTIQGQLLVEEAIPIFGDVPQRPIIETANDLGISDSDLESSEVSEVFQHPPPILRVGDQLLFLKKGEFVSDIGASTPSPVFTIIGAEGLQRGDIDSSEHHGTQKEEEDGNYENVHNESVPVLNAYSHVVSPEAKGNTQLGEFEEVGNQENTNVTETLEESNTDPVKGATDKTKSNFENAKREINVGHILVEELTGKSKIQNETEVESYPTDNSMNVENSTIDVAVQLAVIEPDVASITEDPDISETKIASLLTTKKSEKSSVTTNIYDDLTAEEENIKIRSEEVIPLENPAYPPIPEIMSQQDTDEILENTDAPELELSQLKNIPEVQKAEVILETVPDTNLRILPEILTMRNNHSIPQNISHSEWLKSGETTSETLVNKDAVLPDSILNQVAPSDEITTEEELAGTVSESNEIVEKNTSASNKKILTTDLPVEDLRSEESMFSAIIDKAPHYTKTLSEYDAVEYLSPSENYERNPDEKLRSTETLEDIRSEESGENTTPKNSQQILLDLNGSASVDDYQKDSAELEKSSAVDTDVEMIDLHELQTNATSHVIKRNVTHEEDLKSGGITEKRSSYDQNSDNIFQQLDDEIQFLSKRDGNSTMGEEKKEAHIIFKELFDEVNSSSTEDPKREQGAPARESAILQRVSDTIAKFQLKNAKQSLDTSILGILRDFFNSQYKSYKDN